MRRSTTTGKHPTGRKQRNKPMHDIRTTTTSFPCPSILPYHHHHKYQRGVGQKPRKQTPPSIDRKSSKRQVIIFQPTSESSRRDAWRVRYDYILSIHVFFLILRGTYAHTHTLCTNSNNKYEHTTISPKNVVIVLRYIICIPTCCLFVAKQERSPRSTCKHLADDTSRTIPRFCTEFTHTQHRETTTEWNEAAAGHTVNGAIIHPSKGNEPREKIRAKYNTKINKQTHTHTRIEICSCCTIHTCSRKKKATTSKHTHILMIRRTNE